MTGLVLPVDRNQRILKIDKKRTKPVAEILKNMVILYISI
jgi:hypothetical protein